MAPHSPLTPGISAGGPPAPPLDPHTLNALLARDPARAAAILASMRPRQFDAQVEAHAELTGAPSGVIAWEWRALIARAAPRAVRLAVPLPPGVLVPTPTGAVFDAEMLADLLAVHPKLGHELLAQLTPPQRVTQALAQAAWLSEHGLPTTFDEVLASWPEFGDAAA